MLVPFLPKKKILFMIIYIIVVELNTKRHPVFDRNRYVLYQEENRYPIQYGIQKIQNLGNTDFLLNLNGSLLISQTIPREEPHSENGRVA